MDATRFDALTRTLAAPAPRRAALRLLTGGVLGALLAQRGISPVRAQCAGLGAPCSTDESCCVGYCSQDSICECIPDWEYRYPSGTGGCCNGQPPTADGYCPPTGWPSDCESAGLSECGDFCLDLANDTLNCGTCGVPCLPGAYCSGGVCLWLTDCPAGATECGGRCVDVAYDPFNCGGCGVPCLPGALCRGGVCLWSDCPPGQSEWWDGVCYDNDVFTNVDCDCPQGTSCQGGVCVGVPCPAGLTRCDGSCVDLAGDEFNCGACYNSCPLGGYCSGGVCVAG